MDVDGNEEVSMPPPWFGLARENMRLFITF